MKAPATLVLISLLTLHAQPVEVAEASIADLQKALLAVLDTVAPPEPKAARPARVRSRAKIAAE